MSNGETADQATRMTLQGIEIAANIALKVGGVATKSLAAMLYAILTDKKKVKGKARLQSLLKSGKELKVIAIRHEDLKTFCEEAKHYGVLYSVLKEKNNTDGICDIMVRAEDAGKITRIVDKFELATIDTDAIRKAILEERAGKASPIEQEPMMSEEDHDALVNSLFDSIQPSQDEVVHEPPLQTPNQKDPVFESTLETEPKNKVTSEPMRKSVRKEMSEIKQAQKQKSEVNRDKIKQLSHQQPKKKKQKKVKVR